MRNTRTVPRSPASAPLPSTVTTPLVVPAHGNVRTTATATDTIPLLPLTPTTRTLLLPVPVTTVRLDTRTTVDTRTVPTPVTTVNTVMPARLPTTRATPVATDRPLVPLTTLATRATPLRVPTHSATPASGRPLVTERPDTPRTVPPDTVISPETPVAQATQMPLATVDSLPTRASLRLLLAMTNTVLTVPRTPDSESPTVVPRELAHTATTKASVASTKHTLARPTVVTNTLTVATATRPTLATPVVTDTATLVSTDTATPVPTDTDVAATATATEISEN